MQVLRCYMCTLPCMLHVLNIVVKYYRHSTVKQHTTAVYSCHRTVISPEYWSTALLWYGGHLYNTVFCMAVTVYSTVESPSLFRTIPTTLWPPAPPVTNVTPAATQSSQMTSSGWVGTDIWRHRCCSTSNICPHNLQRHVLNPHQRHKISRTSVSWRITGPKWNQKIVGSDGDVGNGWIPPRTCAWTWLHL